MHCANMTSTCFWRSVCYCAQGISPMFLRQAPPLISLKFFVLKMRLVLTSNKLKILFDLGFGFISRKLSTPSFSSSFSSSFSFSSSSLSSITILCFILSLFLFFLPLYLSLSLYSSSLSPLSLFILLSLSLYIYSLSLHHFLLFCSPNSSAISSPPTPMHNSSIAQLNRSFNCEAYIIIDYSFRLLFVYSLPFIFHSFTFPLIRLFLCGYTLKMLCGCSTVLFMLYVVCWGIVFTRDLNFGFISKQMINLSEDFRMTKQNT